MSKKVFFIMVIFIFIFAFFTQSNPVSAISIDGILSGADEFVNSGKANSANAFNTEIMNDTTGLIYNTLLIIGTVIAVVYAAVLGIQFITGSIEQKVKVQESVIPFIIGCVVIFGAFGIWKLVIELIK